MMMHTIMHIIITQVHSTYTSLKRRYASGGLDAFGTIDMIDNNI